MIDPLINIIHYSGLASTILTTVLLFWTWVNSGLKLKLHTLSECSRKHSRTFSLTLVIFGSLQIIFTWSIITTFLSTSSYWIIIPPIFAGFLIFGLSIYNCVKFKYLHEKMGYAALIILSLWSIVFSFMLDTASNFVGITSLVISIILILATLGTYFRYGLCAIPELAFIIGVFIWNVFFTYVILFL